LRAAEAQGPSDGGAVFAPDGTFVAFNHKAHVADNLIGCSTCHPYARHSAVAGIISMAGCVGCHKFVYKEKPAIRAIAAAVAAGRRWSSRASSASRTTSTSATSATSRAG
jgi:hypothetical protein